jgi:ubiquinone/menaquinone biosynthesis C-methylase UbiE
LEDEVTQPEQWQIAGDAARLYEEYVVRHIQGPWAAWLVDAAGLSNGERVADVACGTGAVTRVAAERVGAQGKVFGIDLNPGMLAVARSLPAPAGAPVEWLQRSALDLGLPDHSVDVVLCQQGLQFFPDQPLALREMHRVLGSGGRLALSVWKDAGIYNRAVGKALTEFLGREVADRFCASRKVPGAQEIRLLASNAGFVGVDVRVGRLDMRLPPLDQFVLLHLASTPVASALAQADVQARKQIEASVVQQLKDYAGPQGVTYPEQIHLLTARY